MKNIAIITARGGSKRIPKKNIKNFLGKPIIAYSIEAAISSNLFEEVIVSTDDLSIAEIAKEYGATIPFMRSAKNSDDFSTTADVLTEVLHWYENTGIHFDHACCIYPTAPFVNAKKLKEAHDKLLQDGFSSVFPVVKFGFPILRSLKLTNNKISLNWPEYLNSRSQDLPDSFHDSGQFYFFKVQDFLKTGKIISDNCGAIIIDELEAQDIDNEVDWKIAELKFKLLKEG